MAVKEGVGESGEESREAFVESFARDLVLLIKSARVYPDGHPTLDAITARLAALPFPGGRGELRLGVTPTELVLDSRFHGGRGKRSTELAKLLYARDIRSIGIDSAISPQGYSRAAALLAEGATGGGKDLGTALAAIKPGAISVEALDVARFHDAFSLDSEAAARTDRERSIEAWLWLHAETAQADEISHALIEEELWERAGENREESGKLAHLLSGLGLRLEQGLEKLPAEQRQDVLERIAGLGRKVKAEQLRDILNETPDTAFAQRYGMAALVGDLEGEKLVDLMAWVLSTGGAKSERLGTLMRQFCRGGKNEAIDLVRKRIKEGDHRDFTLEVWRNLETLLLRVFDGDYVDDGYRAALNEMTAKGVARSYDVNVDFEASAGKNLDLVYLALANSVGGMVAGPWEQLFSRAAELCQNREMERPLALLEAIDKIAPYALDTRPQLLKDFLQTTISRAREVDGDQRTRLMRFVDRHRAALLEPVFASLRDTNRISQRRLLVDLLAGLSPDATPKLVSRARQGPWYLTRNIVIALGRVKDRAAMPFLRSQLDSEEAKVRKEALRALARYGEQAKPHLADFATDPKRESRERELAEGLAQRLGERQ